MNDSFKHSWQVYRRLLRYIQRYWKVLSLSLVSMCIAALTEAAFARLLKPLIDGGFVDKDPATIRWVPLAIIGVFLLRGVTSFINEYTA
ncbi:lipid ABC transporter permease/ATP-binding protein, partial [Bacillus velezensis]